ncbi:hypothetical protein LOZ80_19230 [Paenibacillus sp. HWE-109]|uniref:CLC_0170 family protein n=1 Tax=Paenibacillus sp. HWE-109 TaxID=1306526 RepID=UPI001EDDB0CE|nr:CLC_0170 family protein [Paenibacillus sp. HWE-109]UKS30955.1 hypothetical protein LOZ80_19230 [Paenibacillus sp. HWE-109]
MITFNYYTIMLLLLSGILVLVFDVKIYAKANLTREKKGALILGWLNIVLAGLSYICYFIYDKWFWK